MFSPFSIPRARRAFTLMELLTVMAIIAILVGLLFPVVGSVMNNARKTQASSDETRIMAAVSAYQTDYGKLPLNSDQQGGASSANPSGPQDTCFGDPNGQYPSSLLFNILRGIPDTAATNPKTGKIYNDTNQLNPRKVVYFQGNIAKNPASPRSGFVLVKYHDGNYDIPPGALVDPWGSEYVVWLDATGDGDLNTAIRWFYGNYPQNPGTATYPNAPGPGGPVQVASMGPDGNFGLNGVVKGSDDVVTW